MTFSHDNEHKKIKLFTLIAARRHKDALLEALSGSGLRAVNAAYGQGTARAGMLWDLLGLVPEEKKIVITGLVLEEKVQDLFDILVKEFHFDRPNTGIAFTSPVGRLFY